MRILVVEDEPRVGALARHVLEGGGSVVDVAGSAAAALDLLRDATGGYDVVVIDRVLPDVSGDEVASEVAASCTDAGIVLTSGRIRTSRPFYDVWLEKPYGPLDLVRAVSAALVARSLRRCRATPRTPTSSGLPF